MNNNSNDNINCVEGDVILELTIIREIFEEKEDSIYTLTVECGAGFTLVCC